MSNVLGSFLGGASGKIAGSFAVKAYERRKNRGLRKILNFGDDELIFVTAQRGVPETILPYTSTEDFLAINNVITALLNISWKGPTRVRSPETLNSADKNRNLITVCSPKTNDFTRELLDRLREDGLETPRFVVDKKTDEWSVVNRGARYPSDSYGQIRKYEKEGVTHIAEEKIDDVALILKVRNPWNARNKILCLAGVRGIGTWGAGEFVKKRWSLLLQDLRGSSSADFWAIVGIRYERMDITKFSVFDADFVRSRQSV